MSYNPLEQEYQARCAERAALDDFVRTREQDIDRINGEISKLHKRIVYESKWFNQTNLSDKLDSLNEKMLSLSNVKIDLDNQGQLLMELDTEKCEVKSHIKALLNPIRWFSDKQKELRARLKSLIAEEKSQQDIRDRLSDESSELDRSIKLLNEDIARYRSYYDFCLNQEKETSELNSRRNSYNASVKKAKVLIDEFDQDIDGFLDKMSAIDTLLEPHISELEYFYNMIEETKNTIASASELNEKLIQAKSINERDIYLRNCKDRFDMDFPDKVVGQQMGRLRKLDGDLIELNNKIIAMADRQVE